MNDPASLGFVVVIAIGMTAVFSVWCSVLEKRIQNLADQQEEWWQRHMKNHPKGGE